MKSDIITDPVERYRYLIEHYDISIDNFKSGTICLVPKEDFIYSSYSRFIFLRSDLVEIKQYKLDVNSKNVVLIDRYNKVKVKILDKLPDTFVKTFISQIIRDEEAIRQEKKEYIDQLFKQECLKFKDVKILESLKDL